MSCHTEKGRQSGGKTPEALIAVVAEGDPEAEVALFRQHWQSAVPNAEFVGLAIGAPGTGAPDDLVTRLAAFAAARSLSPSRAILLGRGNAVRAALDLLLSGHVRAGGLLAVDIPLWELPASGPHCRTIIRLLQHRSAADPHYQLFFDLLDEIRRRTLDLRYLLLADPDERTNGAMLRAAGSYLVELVASVSHPPQIPEQAP